MNDHEKQLFEQVIAQKAEWERHERESLRKGICPDSGLPLFRVESGFFQCSVCDCFGFSYTDIHGDNT